MEKDEKPPLGGEHFYRWTVEVAVHPAWVADGFDLTAERLVEILRGGPLDFCTSDEVAAQVLSAPPEAEIKAEQGYGGTSAAPRYCGDCGRLGTMERDEGGEVYCTVCGAH